MKSEEFGQCLRQSPGNLVGILLKGAGPPVCVLEGASGAVPFGCGGVAGVGSVIYFPTACCSSQNIAA